MMSCLMLLPLVSPMVSANVYADIIGNQCHKLCTDVQSAALVIPAPLVTQVIQEVTTALRSWQPSSSLSSSLQSLNLPDLQSAACQAIAAGPQKGRQTGCKRLSLSRVHVRNHRRAITVSMRLDAAPV